MRSRKMPVAVLLAAVVLATTLAASATEPFPAAAKLDTYFDALSGQDLANGSIAISEHGVVRYKRQFGSSVIAPGANLATDADTRYRIGSVTKLFTAVLTLQLVEEGSLTLDDALAKFHPDLPNADAIRYRDLLQHRSGLADYSKAPDFETWRTAKHGRDEILERISGPGARFPPRERVDYSNSNYLLLGYTLEKIHQMPYTDIVRRGIADRLGLLNTYVGNAPDAAQRESVSYEFTPAGWVAQKATDPDLHGGAGSLVSTPSDLVRFVDALFAGRLVDAGTLARMRDVAGGSGMGLWPYTVAGQAGLGHGGSIEGYRACVFHFPESGISLAYATNAPVLAMSEIVDEVLTVLFEPGHAPPTFEPMKLAPEHQAAYAGHWRSRPGTPERTPFRQFQAPDQPIDLTVATSADAPVGTIGGRDFTLVPLGDDEFLIREIGYFLRFYPHRDELVVRGPDWAYYLTRERES